MFRPVSLSSRWRRSKVVWLAGVVAAGVALGILAVPPAAIADEVRPGTMPDGQESPQASTLAAAESVNGN